MAPRTRETRWAFAFFVSYLLYPSDLWGLNGGFSAADVHFWKVMKTSTTSAMYQCSQCQLRNALKMDETTGFFTLKSHMHILLQLNIKFCKEQFEMRVHGTSQSMWKHAAGAHAQTLHPKLGMHQSARTRWKVACDSATANTRGKDNAPSLLLLCILWSLARLLLEKQPALSKITLYLISVELSFSLVEAK